MTEFNIPEWLMFFSAVLLILTWIVYPLFLLIVSKEVPGQAVEAAPCDLSVDVLCSAYNEELEVERRIANLKEALEGIAVWNIRVGNDCSDDDTARILEDVAVNDSRVSVLHATARSGKISMLKRLVNESTADILVFTDANTRFEPDTIQCLLESFGDVGTGGVCGRLIFQAGDAGSEELSYWSYETRLKMRESSLDSCLGANGAIYALRRELFPLELPENTIVDDLVIGMKVREQKLKMKYNERAIAYEDTPVDMADEWRRRVRIGAGDYQALRLCRACLNPKNGWFAFCFFWHKVMRWFTPHLLILMIMAALMALILHASLPGMVVCAVVAAALCTALAGRAIPGFVGRLSSGGYYFLTMQAALFTGWLKYLKGDLKGSWERTTR